MKQVILFGIIFALGALSYSLLNPYLLSLQKDSKDENELTVPTQTINTETVVPKTALETVPEVTKEETVTITPDGSLLDGPFYLTDADGNATEATVEIVRSPEETLLQFKNFTDRHSADADIYFATDKSASSYVTVGFAKLNSDITIYGVPLDADLSAYSYILIYDVRNKKTEFSAKIR